MAVYDTRRYNLLYMLRKIFLSFIPSWLPLAFILSGYYLVSDSIQIGVCIYQLVPWVNDSMSLTVCSLPVTACQS
jgi:hypothetical protein